MNAMHLRAKKGRPITTFEFLDWKVFGSRDGTLQKARILRVFSHFWNFGTKNAFLHNCS